MKLSVKGFDIHSEYLESAAQRAVLAAVRGVVAEAPFFRPQTPSGKQMSVRMTAAGKYGWISDKRGYRYEALHPRASRGQRYHRMCWRYGQPLQDWRGNLSAV